MTTRVYHFYNTDVYVDATDAELVSYLAQGWTLTPGVKFLSKVAARPAIYSLTNLDSADKAGAWFTAGGNTVHIPLYWDRLQITQGGALQASALAEIRGWIANARAKGLRAEGEINIAAAPQWYQDAAPKFRNQAGVDWTGSQIRDMIWSQTARNFIGEFIAKVFAALTVDDLEIFDTFRIGGGPLGELQTPTSHFTGGSTVDWWCYGAHVTGADLAEGQTPRPFDAMHFPWAAVAPGTATAVNSWDRYYAAWYTQSVTNWMLWLIEQHRRGGWGGDLHVLFPSWGVRRIVGDGDSTYRYETAQGTDWEAHLRAFPDDRVHPWQTWANRHDNAVVNGPQDYSPTRYMAYLAHARGRDEFMGCENAAGASDDDLKWIFTDSNGPLSLGYSIYMHVSYDDATGGQAGRATLGTLTSLMKARPAVRRPRGRNLQRRARGADPTPVQSGFRGWTSNPKLLGTGGRVLNPGKTWFQRVQLAAGFNRGVSFRVTNSGASLTAALWGLFALDGTLLAVSADATAVAQAAAGPQTVAWVNPYEVLDDTVDYLVGHASTGTMGVGVLAANNSSTDSTVPNVVAPGFVRAMPQVASVGVAPAAWPAVGSKISLAGLANENAEVWYGVF